jgi:hypothetical protein
MSGNNPYTGLENQKLDHQQANIPFTPKFAANIEAPWRSAR